MPDAACQVLQYATQTITVIRWCTAVFYTRLAVCRLLFAEKCTMVVTALSSSSLCKFAQRRLSPFPQPRDDKSLHGHISEWRSIYRYEE